ncbi:MAG: hypothetical protein MI862_16015 [Desulfobacterales bacterium]|nr:hypothetical protein [Desulfobacterales bacterium]
MYGILNKRLMIAFLFLFVIFLTDPIILLASNPCERYAQEAVRQNQANLSMQAGFQSPGWSSDYKEHYNWCIRGSNINHTPFHLENREKALQAVAVKQGKTAAAKRYAKESVRQNRESKEMGANFPPPVWSSDFNGHYHWSMNGGNIQTTPTHLAEREKALQIYAIKHNKGPLSAANELIKAVVPAEVKSFKMQKGVILPINKSAFCNRYADTALEQVALARKHNLPGIVPPVWSDNRSNHFNWCMGVDQKNAESGSKLRQDFLDKHLNRSAGQKGKTVTMVPGGQIGKIETIPHAVIGKKLTGKEALRDRIDKLDGGAFQVNYTTPFSIPKGKVQTSHLIDIPRAGLYKIGIRLGRSVKNGYLISPRIDKEDYQLVLNMKNSDGLDFVIDKDGNPSPQATIEKKGSSRFSAWIVNDQTLSTFSGVRDKDFYFWVDNDHVPVNGKLRLRLDVVGMTNRKVGETDAQETFKKGFELLPLTGHEGISGNFHVDFAVPHKAGLTGQYTINQSNFPYSIIALPSVRQAKMHYSVIRTSVLQDRVQDTTTNFEPPMVTFLIANSDNIPKPNQGIVEPVKTGGTSVKFSRNEWYYKTILEGKVFGQKQDCGTITVNEKNVCAKYKMIRPPASHVKAKIFDLANPEPGEIAIIVNNNPIGSESQHYSPPSLELLGTKGYLTSSALSFEPGDNLRNEVLVTARNMKLDWTYVAELSALEISDQAEHDDDGDDANFGEFSVLTTSVAVKPKLPGQITLGSDQIENRSAVYPIVDVRDNPSNFPIMDRDNPIGLSPKKREAMTIPGIPVFVMGYDELQQFNHISLNVTMVEHDERTMWQELETIGKLFKDYMSALVKAVSKPGFGSLTALGKSIYDFATTDLNYSPGVDDMMGNAGITLYKADNYGLSKSGPIAWDVHGPADSGCFDMQLQKQGTIEAVVSKEQPDCKNPRHMTAHFNLRRIPKLEGWADIQLIDFSPVDLLPGRMSHSDVEFVSRDFYITEGVLSNKNDNFRSTAFKNIGAINKLKVRAPVTPDQLLKRTPGILPSDTLKDGYPYFGGTSWSNRGFSYYQAKVSQYLACVPDDLSARFNSYISFTLYYEDVVRFEGLKDYQVLRRDGYRDVMAIKSTKMPGSNIYKVDIRLRNPGNWIKEANLVAYVSIE